MIPPLPIHSLQGYNQVSIPVGGVIPYAGEIFPQSPPKTHVTQPIEAWGWMNCDGRSLNPHQYPELFSALGYLYGGSGDHFSLPNFSGQFLRGVATSQAATENRKPAVNGQSQGVGSTQMHSLQSHTHDYSKAVQDGVGGTSSSVAVALASQPTSDPKTSAGKQAVSVSDYETRPDNIFVYYLIKYTYQISQGMGHTHY